jgi:hypothetical protein
VSSLIQKLPILTTIGAIAFSYILFRQWLRQSRPVYLAWWSAGMLFYGLGALAESCTALFGWHEFTFRAWYIFGAICGAAPLAQGTVYLLIPRAIAHRLTAVLLGTMAIAAVCIVKTPIVYGYVDSFRLTGYVMEWQWVRNFSPLINLYALFFLTGGALYSAWRYWMETESRNRFFGNVFIALGALLPAIGGSIARRGSTDWLYVTELLAVWVIWHGYKMMKDDPMPSIHTKA